MLIASQCQFSVGPCSAQCSVPGGAAATPESGKNSKHEVEQGFYNSKGDFILGDFPFFMFQDK